MKAGGLKLRAELELDRLALDPYCKLYLPLWKLDGDSFADHSAYGHLCTRYGIGTPPSAHWTPQGWVFDGVDDYVEAPHIHSDLLTVEAWVKRNGAQDDNDNIVSQSSSSAGPPYYEFILGMATDQKVRFGITTDTVYAGVISTVAIPDLTCVHLAGVYDGGYLRLCVNSVQETPVVKTGLLMIMAIL